ncbi:hypothetical protein FIU87_03640 [Bacillus sp. THAF10]|uniref:hypothetical protein n=1 Tax=Bacillus sp. THAF10 TaxID=2587848 RepID=UPI001268EDD1|nr:hypothetical protein [Bacillus sp. THAF10]QFT87736.1 hypothetical protein FIU87_03640 [Bacillus sp. THAF10]
MVAINKVQIMLWSSIYSFINHLEEQHKEIIENKWIIWVVILIALLAGIGYAYYCTSKGYAFSGKLKWNWPRVWDIGIGCKPV